MESRLWEPLSCEQYHRVRTFSGLTKIKAFVCRFTVEIRMSHSLGAPRHLCGGIHPCQPTYMDLHMLSWVEGVFKYHCTCWGCGQDAAMLRPDAALENCWIMQL